MSTATTHTPETAPSGAGGNTSGPPRRSRLLPGDVLRLGTTGLRARPTRAILSALGMAIGVAAMVAVVGISSSSQAQLDERLARLGTNLLTATAGTDFTGEETTLPANALDKVGMVDDVESASSTAELSEPVYRNPLSDQDATGGITTMVAEESLLDVVSGRVGAGRWLDRAQAGFPSVVVGHAAAERLGVVSPGTQVWLGGRYFTVVGILDPVALAPELDSAALVGEDVATRLFGFDGSPTTVYERSADEAVDSVRSLLGPTISPESPEQVEVSRPSDALAAKNAADQAFTGLLVGLGAVALLVGGIGVANTMIISVLERRREIGLRRALGATRWHVLVQFLGEALLLSALGGVAGCGIGAAVTGGMAVVNDWPFALPPATLGVAVVATLVIGAVAGFSPALRAARTNPATALNA